MGKGFASFKRKCYMHHMRKPSRQGGNKLRTKPLATLCLFILLTAVSGTFIASTHAVGEGEWIKKYTVEDLSTGEMLLEVDFEEGTEAKLAPILAGSELKVTFTVDVFASGEGNLQLRTELDKVAGEDQIWNLVSEDYDLGSAYNPAQKSTVFNWELGTFEMTCTGRVRQLTKPTNVSLVGLYGPTGSLLDNIKPFVLTAGGSEFQNLYDQREDKLRTLIDSGVAAGYTEMYENMLNQSEALNNAGLTEEAIALLNAIPSSGEPMGSALEMILLPAIGVAAAAAVIFAFMFLRARGKNSYVQLVIEDQIKDLEGLTLRASRVDRTISSSLESVKDRLKNLVGM
jgi:hypothetical protein